MNKSKFSEKLLTGFLVLICFLSLILVPSAGSISENAGPETHRELFGQSRTVRAWVNDYAVTMIRDLINEVNHTDLGYADLLISADQQQRLLEDGWTQSEINEQKSQLDWSLQQELENSLQLGNLHALAIDNVTKTTVRRPKTNVLAQTDSELSKNYQFWIRAEYDSYGVLSVTSNSGYGYSDFYPLSVLTNYVQYYGDFSLELHEPVLKDITLIFGIPNVLESDDAITSLIHNAEYYSYRQLASRINMVLYFILFLGALYFTRGKMRDTRLGKLLDRIPLEAQILVTLIALLMIEEMSYNLGGIMLDLYSQSIDDMNGVFQILGYEFTFLLECFGLYCAIYWIRAALRDGWRQTWSKMATITLWRRLWHGVRHGWSTLKQWTKECFTVDFSEKAHSRLIRLMVVNVALISVLCLLLDDFFAAVIYTVFLYFIIMRALKRLRSDYETLLGCTRRMARGDLETEVHEDLGIFEPLHSELDDIRYGFNTAIAEETKSQKMKTELISNVSHDLKTPLTSLISYIDLMKQEPDEARRQEYLAVLERNSMRLKHLIEDLFEVSKANSGDLKLNVVDVDLVSLISQTLFELAPAIENAGLTIKTSYSHDKIVLPLDSQKTYRIVENLVSNVTKYSLRGSRVYLTLIERGEEVVLSIRNISQTEIDFDPNDLVERFVRGDKSRNSEGSGLGLAIAKGFAESQHAHFTIQTDGDFFKVIVIFNRRALEDLKPKPAETVKLDMPQAPLIDILKNNENKI